MDEVHKTSFSEEVGLISWAIFPNYLILARNHSSINPVSNMDNLQGMVVTDDNCGSINSSINVISISILAKENIYFENCFYRKQSCSLLIKWYSL
jgi:hypothetical protein